MNSKQIFLPSEQGKNVFAFHLESFFSLSSFAKQTLLIFPSSSTLSSPSSVTIIFLFHLHSIYHQSLASIPYFQFNPSLQQSTNSRCSLNSLLVRSVRLSLSALVLLTISVLKLTLTKVTSSLPSLISYFLLWTLLSC